jgi:hypothetical protein
MPPKKLVINRNPTVAQQRQQARLRDAIEEREELAELEFIEFELKRERRKLLLKEKRAELAGTKAQLNPAPRPRVPAEEKQREEKEERLGERNQKLILTDTGKNRVMGPVHSFHFGLNDFALSRDTILPIAQRMFGLAASHKDLHSRQMKLDLQSAGGIGNAFTDIIVSDANGNLTLEAIVSLLTQVLENKIASTSGGEWLAIDLSLIGISGKN